MFSREPGQLRGDKYSPPPRGELVTVGKHPLLPWKISDHSRLRLKSHKSEVDSPWSTKTQPNTLSPRPWHNICSNAVLRPGWGGPLGHQVARLVLAPATQAWD